MSSAITNPFQSYKQSNRITYKDLTQQFQKTAHNCQPHQFPRQNNYKNPNSDFFEKANQIKRRLDLTEDRLEEFNKQQKRQGLFDNDESKLSELLQLIQENIQFIQKGFNILIQEQNNADGNTDYLLRKAIVEIVQAKFIDQTEKFKKSVQSRSEILSKNHEKSSMITKFQTDGVTNRKAAFKKKKIPQDDSSFQNRNSDFDIEGGGGGNDQQSLLYNNENKYKQRENQMTNIRDKLIQIGGMFQTMASKVKLQEIIIERIDKDTSDSLQNVDKSKKNLIDAKKKQEGSRALMIKLFLLMFVFAFVYILFLL